ncbi:MAG: DHH family phosphoesterase, partial [Acidobacteriaceae bacterium]
MTPLCRPLVDVLKHRGIADHELFLAPSTWRDMPSPFLIEGMEEAVASILTAVRSQQRIRVYGDYDCDGALSSAILEATLRKLGAQPAIYLPHRDEGYGFTEAAVHRFSRSGTDLVITIDNGINAAGPIRLAKRLGMDVIVVDHHHIETRADATAVWSANFCAAGLGLMLCWALLDAAEVPHTEVSGFLASLSRLAAIASIADCVPLTGVTRTLTRIGLAELGRTRHAGLRKLLLLAGVRFPQPPTSEQIAFRIAPRMNAAGRVAHPDEVLRML